MKKSISLFSLFMGGTLLLLAMTGCQSKESTNADSSAEKAPAAADQKTAPEPATSSTQEPATPPAKEAAAEPGKESPDGKQLAASNAKVPLGLPPLSVPEDNPLTPEKIELGKMLYFDKRLSKDGTISCATCHDPKMAWAENRPTSEGIDKQLGDRNSPTVINAAYATSQFWDGRAKTMEEQALGPIENPIEMGHELSAMIANLSQIEDYTARFQKVFGTPVTKEGVAKAIAAFERTVLSGNSPYDRYKAGDETALDDSQKRGLDLFEDNCSNCHTPPLFSNYRFYNAGVGTDAEKPDEGRKKATGKEADLGKFRVAPLREVEKTSPYFHDGRTATLEEAVALMAAGGKDNPKLSAQMKAVRESKLTAENQKDLVNFLKSLSGDFPTVEPPKLP